MDNVEKNTQALQRLKLITVAQRDTYFSLVAAVFTAARFLRISAHCPLC